MQTRQEMLGVWLRNRRKELRLSQQELADKVGIDDARVSRLESGAQAITIAELEPFAVALKTDVLTMLKAIGVPTGIQGTTPLHLELVDLTAELSDKSLESLIATAHGLRLLEQAGGSLPRRTRPR